MTLNEMQIVCVARFIAKEGEEDKLMKDLYSLIEHTRKEDGCIRYELNQCIKFPREVTFIEKWVNMQTFEEHNNKDYIKNFFNDGAPNHVHMFDVTLYKEVL